MAVFLPFGSVEDGFDFRLTEATAFEGDANLGLGLHAVPSLKTAVKVDVPGRSTRPIRRKKGLGIHGGQKLAHRGVWAGFDFVPDKPPVTIFGDVKLTRLKGIDYDCSGVIEG
jgi:hypothetical protein